MGYAVVWLVNTVVTLYIWVIIIMAVMSWLIAFNVINARNAFVYQVLRFFDAVTEPALRPLRKVVPSLGGIDLTPIVLILGLQFLLIIFKRTAAPYLLLMG